MIEPIVAGNVVGEVRKEVMEFRDLKSERTNNLGVLRDALQPEARISTRSLRRQDQPQAPAEEEEKKNRPGQSAKTRTSYTCERA
jgi:hypothetical protein